jgi:hypothetical protein
MNIDFLLIFAIIALEFGASLWHPPQGVCLMLERHPDYLPEEWAALSERARTRAWRMSPALLTKEQALVEQQEAGLTGAQRMSQACALSMLAHDTFLPHPAGVRWHKVRLDRGTTLLSKRCSNQ